MTPYVEKLLPLCQAMADTALAIAGQAQLTLTEHKLAEPKLLALALMSRTLGNFKGVVIMVQHDMLVEARVLARCCYENLFILGALHTEGMKFVEQLKADDLAARQLRMKFFKENAAAFQNLSEETLALLRKAEGELEATTRAQFLRFKGAAQVGPFRETYMAYIQYSGDAAHPTLKALSRHLTVENKEAIFDVVPTPKPWDVDETLHLSCIALMAIMVTVNEMNGFTEAGKELVELNNQLRAFQGEKFGENSVGEGMEIKIEPESCG